MEIIPVAFDSMGARSQCTFVKCRNLNIIIDPAAELGPSRYGLSPHKTEIKKCAELKEKIKDYLKKSDAIIITHYHFDHVPDFNDIKSYELFKGKKVFVKNCAENINASQKSRASKFRKIMKELDIGFEEADSRSFNLNGVEIKFSAPVFHGEIKTRLGYVIMVSIKEGNKKFVFGSDAQGPIDKTAQDFVINENPDTAVLDGPISYMLHYRLSQENFELAKKALENILKNTKSLKTLVYEHHLVRDLKYREKYRGQFELADRLKIKLVTAAEYLGIKNNFLEAERKSLFS